VAASSFLRRAVIRTSVISGKPGNGDIHSRSLGKSPEDVHVWLDVHGESVGYVKDRKLVQVRIECGAVVELLVSLTYKNMLKQDRQHLPI
jgi:hypothetical protein